MLYSDELDIVCFTFSTLCVMLSGDPKPWTSLCENHKNRAGIAEWLDTLKAYQNESGIVVNADHVCKKSINPVTVGFPTYIHMYNNTIKKRDHGWEQYVTDEGTTKT